MIAIKYSNWSEDLYLCYFGDEIDSLSLDYDPHAHPAFICTYHHVLLGRRTNYEFIF